MPLILPPLCKLLALALVWCRVKAAVLETGWSRPVAAVAACVAVLLVVLWWL